MCLILVCVLSYSLKTQKSLYCLSNLLTNRFQCSDEIVAPTSAGVPWLAQQRWVGEERGEPGARQVAAVSPLEALEHRDGILRQHRQPEQLLPEREGRGVGRVRLSRPILGVGWSGVKSSFRWHWLQKSPDYFSHLLFWRGFTFFLDYGPSSLIIKI